MKPCVPFWPYLPTETQKLFNARLAVAKDHFSKRRYDKALKALDAADSIFKDHPKSLNYRGACHVHLRDFDQAEQAFQKALNGNAGNINVQFNLAEIRFVKGKWDEAKLGFEKVLPHIPNDNKQMLHLTEYKILICNLGLKDLKTAKKQAEIHRADKTSPHFIYSQIVLAYYAKDETQANRLLRQARTDFPDSKDHTVWLDCLIETGYIKKDQAAKRAEESE